MVPLGKTIDRIGSLTVARDDVVFSGKKWDIGHLEPNGGSSRKSQHNERTLLPANVSMTQKSQSMVTWQESCDSTRSSMSSSLVVLPG